MTLPSSKALRRSFCTAAAGTTLAQKGYELAGLSHQHEDHLGLELSALVLLIEEYAKDPVQTPVSELITFIDQFLLSWLSSYKEAFGELKQEVQEKLTWYILLDSLIEQLLLELKDHCQKAL